MEETNKKISWNEWWSKNSNRVLKERRERYKTDRALRSKMRSYSKKVWLSGERDRIKRREDKMLAKREELEQKIKHNTIKKLIPKKVQVNGQKIVVYPMIYLAKELGVDSIIVKRLAKLGVIPKATLVDRANRLWYSQEYLDALGRVFIKVKAKFWTLSIVREKLKILLPNFDWSKDEKN